jgi:predicted phosphodiesterase
MERFAVIADVHGNRWALEAVLEDIAWRDVRRIVNVGDHLFGPLDPAGTARLLMRLNLPSVGGNQDRELIDDSPAEPGSTKERNRAALTPHHREWLASLPFKKELPGGVLMFHGTPSHDDMYLLETVNPDGTVSPASAIEVAERLGTTQAPLLLCGHTHIPRLAEFHGCTIVNPGSVGLQAYADDSPVTHVMENNSPHARYAIVEKQTTHWRVDHIAIGYDVESAAAEAERNARPDWAWRLRTGRANS